MVDNGTWLFELQVLSQNSGQCRLTIQLLTCCHSNRDRRHLTPSQLAMVGDELREHYDDEAKERQVRKPSDSVVEKLPQQNGKARDQAGKAVGVSGKSIDHATKVLRNGTPAVQQAVESGSMAVSKADQKIRRRLRPASQIIWASACPGKYEPHPFHERFSGT